MFGHFLLTFQKHMLKSNVRKIGLLNKQKKQKTTNKQKKTLKDVNISHGIIHISSSQISYFGGEYNLSEM